MNYQRAASADVTERRRGARHTQVSQHTQPPTAAREGVVLTYYAVSAELGNNTFRVDWRDTITQNTSEESRMHRDIITIPDGNYDTSFESISDTNLATIEVTVNTLLRACSSGRDDGPLRLRDTVDRVSGHSVFAQDISSHRTRRACSSPLTVVLQRLQMRGLQ